MDITAFLGPLGRVIDEVRGRPHYRVTVKRNVSVDDQAPADRYLMWGGNRTKKYILLGIQNTSTKPSVFMRATLEKTKLPYRRPLSKKNDGVELLPRETTHFLLEEDEVGDLVGASVVVEAVGYRKLHQL